MWCSRADESGEAGDGSGSVDSRRRQHCGAVELTRLATVADLTRRGDEVVAVDPSTADGGSGRGAVELTRLATVAAAVIRRQSQRWRRWWRWTRRQQTAAVALLQSS